MPDDILKKDVKYIKGVGPNRVKVLNKLGINSLKDLITYFPRAYEDRSQIKSICDIQDGEKATIEATIVQGVTTRMLMKRRSIAKAVISDGTENILVTWFNQPYIKSELKRGETYRFYGRVSIKNGEREMNSPVFDEIGKYKNTSKIIPIYPLTEDIKATTLRRIIEAGLESVGEIKETIPDYLLKKYSLISLNEAIHQIHFPDNFEMFHKARRRLVFDELLSMQLGLLKLKSENNIETKGQKCDKKIKISKVINDLPFKLTSAQSRVLEEIDNDLESSKSMNRLLQGDVGSGKTIVSIIASYKVVKSGFQVAILAPTMILARQHMANFEKVLNQYGIKCGLLVGGMKAKEKQELLEKVAKGEIDILIGTHALLEENVVFKNLGFVVTDEQHRFGVKQRSTISSKGENPNVLVMSATPIPRTLALILYGDLDISIIDELPPNRQKIETYAVSRKMEERVNNFVKEQVNAGRQCYIVCPLVEESEGPSYTIRVDEKTGEQSIIISKGTNTKDLKNVTDMTEKYKNEVFKDYNVENLHGKMKPKEKEEIMQRFKDGKIDILISTTVIEVGVDVPNANIMVIENSERFGLAQLHQLRGRVGRGEYKSYCILKYAGYNEQIKKRLELMTKTNDGFVIAEKDLEFRGSGDFFGTKQHGLPEFKIVNLFEDMEELKEVQALAISIIAEDPDLSSEKNKLLALMANNKFSTDKNIII